MKIIFMLLTIVSLTYNSIQAAPMPEKINWFTFNSEFVMLDKGKIDYEEAIKKCNEYHSINMKGRAVDEKTSIAHTCIGFNKNEFDYFEINFVTGKHFFIRSSNKKGNDHEVDYKSFKEVLVLVKMYYSKDTTDVLKAMERHESKTK